MRNKYNVVGDKVIIHLYNGMATAVNLKHLDRLIAFPGRWTLDRDYRTGTPYVKSQVTINGKTTTTILARFITQARKDQVVDHKDGDTLNNLDSNLRPASPAFNSQNQEVESHKNKTGVRGIRLNRHGRYRPVPMVNGRRYSLPSSDNIEEAERTLIAFYERMGVPYRKARNDEF